MHAKDLLEQCHALLGARAEGVQQSLATTILHRYRQLGDQQRLTFLTGLAGPFDPSAAAVSDAVSAWTASGSTEDLSGMLAAVEPPRRRLFRRLHLARDATSALVSLRADLLGEASGAVDLDRVDIDLRYLLRSWFTRGFLELRRIDWSTPAVVLERIATNEAVHEVDDWLDLRARVKPRDRRCFGFFHPAMPDQPLIFVMVALTTSLPKTIDEVLVTQRTPMPASAATTAVFYSISNCQPGLRGISLGNFLIKQVAAVLSAELPSLQAFLTLSPITGLAQWADPPEDALVDSLAGTDLAGLAARYLVTAKRDNGTPLDPVARFHLGNGASLDRILVGADESERGQARSFGVMASYRYDLARVGANHDSYATSGRVIHSRRVGALLG